MDTYNSPFAERYSSEDMLKLFSANYKFRAWRRLWVALAEVERELGLPISDSQIEELRSNVDNIDYEAVAAYEKRIRHDVMAHIKAYGDRCPTARGIIHLGATSAYVVDNTDCIVMREALILIRNEIVNVISGLTDFAQRYADLPTVAYTHFQPAQFTTVGKRTCLWIQDLLIDLNELNYRLSQLKFLGVKGATGTQASFLELFNGDHNKVNELDRRIANVMGFADVYPVSGQTYSRKVDAQITSTLAGVAQSAHKFANDLRLLQHLGEILEPANDEQVGSTAMAYKRNPMKAERMTSLARLVITLSQNSSFTAANQWFERTLDDSAGKRISIPESFLGIDAILCLWMDIISKMVVNYDSIKLHVDEQLPAIATENILMAAVKAGGDRQKLHEIIRQYSRNNGTTLLQHIANDPAFVNVADKIDELGDPSRYIGRACEQTNEFITNNIKPVLAQYNNLLGWKSVVKV